MGNRKLEEPLSVDQQIKNLKDLDLIINNEEDAKSFLNDVSYYRFIKAYSLTLKSKNSKYNSGVTFEQIKDLYLFNCNFRHLIFEQIEKIEINLRCRVSNYFCCKYGNTGYLQADNFKNAVFFKSNIKDIKIDIERNSKSPFVKNFSINYENGDIPFYAAVELLSFGTLSKFFKNMKNEDKKEVTKVGYGVGYTYFESWIEHLAYVRNVCAHYGRLYNAKMPKTPKLYSQYDDMNIGNNRVYATLICLKYLLPNDIHWKVFVDNVELVIDKYDAVDISTMGFPQNWKEILLCNK